MSDYNEAVRARHEGERRRANPVAPLALAEAAREAREHPELGPSEIAQMVADHERVGNPASVRFWYFSRLNDAGGEFDRFGPYESKSAATKDRDRAERLMSYRVGPVHSSKERFISNIPSWSTVRRGNPAKDDGPPRIVSYTTTYQPWEEGQDEPDSEVEENEAHVPDLDEEDIEEGLTLADKAARYLSEEGANEPSSSSFHPGIWYIHTGEASFRTGEHEQTSYHLKGFSPEDEERVHAFVVKGNRRYGNPAKSGHTPTSGMILVTTYDADGDTIMSTKEVRHAPLAHGSDEDFLLRIARETPHGHIVAVDDGHLYRRRVRVVRHGGKVGYEAHVGKIGAREAPPREGPGRSQRPKLEETRKMLERHRQRHGNPAHKLLPSTEEFIAAYLTAALWSSTDNADESGGEPLDKNYDVDDIDEASLEHMRAECQAFLDANDADILDGPSTSHTQYEIAGHDFWLTRNGHGAGFWDGDWPEPAATRLTEASKKFGEQDIYVGDDGKLHVSPMPSIAEKSQAAFEAHMLAHQETEEQARARRGNPLTPGSTPAVVSKNISKLIKKDHKPQKQAVAIALSNARKHPTKGKPLPPPQSLSKALRERLGEWVKTSQGKTFKHYGDVYDLTKAKKPTKAQVTAALKELGTIRLGGPTTLNLAADKKHLATTIKQLKEFGAGLKLLYGPRGVGDGGDERSRRRRADAQAAADTHGDDLGRGSVGAAGRRGRVERHGGEGDAAEKRLVRHGHAHVRGVADVAHVELTAHDPFTREPDLWSFYGVGDGRDAEPWAEELRAARMRVERLHLEVERAEACRQDRREDVAQHRRLSFETSGRVVEPEVESAARGPLYSARGKWRCPERGLLRHELGENGQRRVVLHLQHLGSR